MPQIEIRSESIDLYDLSLDSDAGDHLSTSDAWSTPVLISLMTDRRAADAAEVPGRGLGGWWGDTYPDDPGYMLGSRLWTLIGSPYTEATRARAESYAREALQWMIDLAVIPSQDYLTVDLEWAGPLSRLDACVTCRQPGTPVDLWRVAWTATLG
jgi:phage gp46-like protein